MARRMRKPRVYRFQDWGVSLAEAGPVNVAFAKEVRANLVVAFRQFGHGNWIFLSSSTVDGFPLKATIRWASEFAGDEPANISLSPADLKHVFREELTTLGLNELCGLAAEWRAALTEIDTMIERERRRRAREGVMR